jgi:hypothetical protein
MKNLKLLIAYAALASCCALVACDQGLFSSCRKDDYSFIADNSFTFGIFDRKTKENILVIGRITYNRDTVQVYNENWEEARKGSVAGDGFIQLRFLKEEDNGVVGKLTNRRFYMYFNYQDIDTIDIAFKAMRNDCNEQALESLKVSYNDSIYLDGPIEKFYANFLK